MDLKELQSFVTIVRSGSITAAARVLNISQPALTRQMQLLEEELGTELMIRGNRTITLTDHGFLLYKRAEELLNLAEKTRDEIIYSDKELSGSIHVKCTETTHIRFLTRAVKNLQQKYPLIQVHISGGDTSDIIYQLDNGLIDFGLVLDPIDTVKYYSIRIPENSVWGILVPQNSPYCERSSVRLEEFMQLPLIVPKDLNIEEFFHKSSTQFRIAATYTQQMHAESLVADGVGFALCLNDIINSICREDVIFCPLAPKAGIGFNIIWKKNHIFTKATECYLQELYQLCNYPI